MNELRRLAAAADAELAWPHGSWALLRQTGAMEWCIPAQHGGQELSGFELLACYETLAASCLTTAFILSQREGACRRIRDQGDPALRQELLPALARGEVLATVGLSHLTTSRQHGEPAMHAELDADSITLNGVMPWVTGAAMADYFLTGGTLDDGQQIMMVLPRRTDGVTIGPPLDLMALCGSMTAEVACRGVRVDRRWLLAGPVERVMAAGKAGTGGLETSALALGLARAAIEYLEAEAKSRPELRTGTERLEHTRTTLLKDLRTLAENSGTPEAALTLRARANAQVLRATQAALTASKGAGFLKNHPAQRWARQAMFFLVWSCPRPAAEATLAYLMPANGLECA